MTDREHFEQLASEHDVGVFYTEAMYEGKAHTLLREVYVAPITADEDDAPYLMALHELGHLLSEQSPGARLFGGPELLANEARAWRWALDHMRRPLTETGRHEVGGGLGSYFRGNGYWPESDGADVVRSLLEELGAIELPWPKTNEAFQKGREAYLGVAV